MSVGSEIWTQRYQDALTLGVIKQRAETRGAAVQDLITSEIEVACDALQRGLEEVHLVSVQVEAVVRTQIERALSHAKRVYAGPSASLAAMYTDGSFRFEDAYMPSLITGLAGVGKSRMRKTIQRVLAGRAHVSIDPAHPKVPLVEYADCVIAQQPSVMAVLRPLANPEVAAGRVKVGQGDLPAECARWQYGSGACLLGVDETQFMAQSDSATTLITRTLLALADVRLPWFVGANYSLCWKLLARPSEALQRLLSGPVEPPRLSWRPIGVSQTDAVC